MIGQIIAITSINLNCLQCAMFLSFSQKRAINLEKPYLKILQLAPAFQESLVLLTYLLPDSRYMISHVDRQGREQFAYIGECVCPKMMMLDDRNMVIIERELSKIKKIDLQRKRVDSILHEFISKTSSSLFLFNFTSTSLMAIVEYNDDSAAEEHYLTISYFHKAKIDIVFHSSFYFRKDSANSWDKISNDKAKFIGQGNDSSMVVWCDYNQRERLSLTICEVIQNYEGRVREVQIGLTELPSIKHNGSTISVLQVKQTDRCSLRIFTNMIIEVNQVDENQEDSQGSQNDAGVLAHYEIIINQDTKQSHYSRLSFSGQPQEIVSSLYFINRATIFYTLQFDHLNELSQSLKYYFDDTKKLIFFVEPFEFSRDEHVCFDEIKKEMVEWHYQKDKSSNMILVKYGKVWLMKELVLFWLLHLNEDFDDDLLSDAIELLDIQ